MVTKLQCCKGIGCQALVMKPQLLCPKCQVTLAKREAAELLPTERWLKPWQYVTALTPLFTLWLVVDLIAAWRNRPLAKYTATGPELRRMAFLNLLPTIATLALTGSGWLSLTWLVIWVLFLPIGNKDKK